MVRLLQPELRIRPGRLDQLAQRVIGELYIDLDDPGVNFPVPIGGDGGDQRLFIGKMGIGRSVADAGFARRFAQAQPANAFSGQDIDPGLDQGIFQIAVVVGFVGYSKIS